MANNRLWLVYRPTGRAVFLGKRMAQGWYNVPDDIAQRIRALYEHIEQHPEHSQDDLCLSMEECEADTPFVNTRWHYRGKGESPLSQLEMRPADAH